MTDDEIIDKTLFKMNENYRCEEIFYSIFSSFEKCDDNRTERIKDKMIDEGLVEQSHMVRIKLKPRGAEICKNGGWLKYLEILKNNQQNKQKHEEMDVTIKELTIKELKGNIFQLKKWWLLLIINAIISILCGVLIARLTK